MTASVTDSPRYFSAASFSFVGLGGDLRWRVGLAVDLDVGVSVSFDDGVGEVFSLLGDLEAVTDKSLDREEGTLRVHDGLATSDLAHKDFVAVQRDRRRRAPLLGWG